MSTRRARIKAVTSLPPRRKNADNADAVKKQVKAIDNGEKAAKSPRTPRSIFKAIESTEKKSPAGRIASPLKSPHNVTKTPTLISKLSPFKKAFIEPQKDRKSPKLAEKVPVITSTAAFKHNNVFISPQSPLTRVSTSTVVRTPNRVAPDDKVHKIITPSKGKEESAKVNSNESQETPNKTNIVESNSSNTSKESRIDVIDVDYNVPSVPESLPEDTVMDGIVPLKSQGSVPHPIAMLKDEITSEHAEVLFDPIVPLPSPSKVRPKLRPVPRLAPLRRNSIQGSASESEDESRRSLLGGGAATPAPARQRHDSQTSHSTLHSGQNREVNRTRNDSVCSNMSQATAQPASASSPVKEKHYAKTRRQDANRRNNAMRRCREGAKRETLTMYDLIFYNPTANPIVPDEDELKAKEENEKGKVEAEAAKEEEADDPPLGDGPPVPQVKIGPNGEIILDEKSLIINQSERRKVTSVVREGAWGGVSAGYRRAARTAEWPAAETVRFYRALAALGTDFTLMEPLFPGRTRRDLKLKFKKEEKINIAQVDKALRTGAPWDAMRLQKEFEEERAEAARREAERRAADHHERRARLRRTHAARAHAIRTSQGTKALDYTSIPGSDHSKTENGTADHLIQKVLELKAKRKRKTKRRVEPPNSPSPVISSTPETHPEFATLTLNKPDDSMKTQIPQLPNVTRVEQTKQTLNLELVPANIENGSLVVLSVNDPNSPSKKMLQTYIAHGGGKLTPVDLPPSLLNSVVGYMKQGSLSTGSSPQLLSPNSVDSHSNSTSNSSPSKRQRCNSFTISKL